MKVNLVVGLTFLVFMTSFVFAVGVAQPYWEGNPLRISPGGSEDVELTLQNMVGDEDVVLRAELVDGAGIATLPSKVDYDVKFGTSDTKVPVTVKIPGEAELGKEYTVKLSFKTVTPGEQGGVSLGLGYEVNFDVLVVEETEMSESSGIQWILWVIGIIVLVLIMWVVLRALSKKK